MPSFKQRKKQDFKKYMTTATQLNIKMCDVQFGANADHAADVKDRQIIEIIRI